MAVNFNGFNIGTDFSAAVSDNFGNRFSLDQLGLVMDFDLESMDRELEVIPISGGGIPLFLTIWAGVRGTISFTRTNANLQNMIMDLMAAYYGLGLLPIFSMQCSVLNRNGLIDEMQVSGLQWSKPKLGTFRSEKEVDQKIEFRASLLTRTGASAAFLTALAA